QVGSLLVVGVGADVSPFIEQGPVEAFDFAIDLGAIERSEDLASSELGDSGAEVTSVAVGESVVSHYSLDLDAMAGQEDPRSAQEVSAGGRLLVRQHLRVGQARVVVHQRVHEVVALSPFAVGPLVASQHSMPTAGRNPAQLLDVNMDHLARAIPLV